MIKDIKEDLMLHETGNTAAINFTFFLSFSGKDFVSAKI
jgi:hypothetical protein